jgi:hypothetical protein
MPLDLDDIGVDLRAWRPPDEEQNLISGVDQTLDQRPAYQAASAAQ